MSFVYFHLGRYAFTAPAAASLATALVVLAFGVWVVVREPDADEALWFLVFCGMIALWQGCFAVMYASPDATAALQWLEPGYMGLALVPAAAYRMTTVILGRSRRRLYTLSALFVAGLAVAVAVGGGDFGIRGIAAYRWGRMHLLGTGGIPIATAILGGMGLVLYEYVREVRLAGPGPRRDRLVRILSAFAIGTLAAVDFLPSVGVGIRPLGSLALLAGMGLLASVLGRHRFVELTPGYAADAILRAMSDLLVAADASGRVRLTNEALRDLLGREARELEGLPLAEILRAPDGSPAPVPSADEEGVRRDERSLRGRHGDEIPVEATFTDLRDEGGRRTGTLVIGRDLRVQRATERTLRATEERFSTVFRISPLPIILTRLDDTTILEVNRAFEEFSGWSREELLGSPASDLPQGPDPRAVFRVADRVRDGETVRGVEVRLPTRGGDIRDVLAFADRVPLDDADAMLLVFSDITRRKAAERELRRRALYDYLTGLPNRALFHSRLAHALQKARRQGSSVGVLFLDLDGFKDVNDSLGHEAGDRLLREVAERLSEAVRGEDTVARLGGDEFAVLIEEARGRADAEAAAARLEEAFDAPFRPGGRDLDVSVSIGVALAEPGEVGPDDLLRRSDLAMYRAKEGRGTVSRFFDPEREGSTKPTRRRARENDLQRALKEDELSLRFQPVLEVDSGRIRAAEALVRWEHPERGTLEPAEFLPLAEESGLILSIGDWVLGEACRRAAAWEERGLLAPGFRVIVNVSAREADDPGLAGRVRAALTHAGLPGERLQLDMPERALLGAREELDALRSEGVRFSVDDFGARHSAVGVLRSLRAEELKLAPEFVDHLSGEGRETLLFEAVLGVASRLGIEVVAEGVETAEVLERLKELGCPLAQGFHLGRPAPAERLESLLAGQRGGGGRRTSRGA